MAKPKKRGKWLQKARKSMEERGTVGKFGKATPGKIKRAKAHGGVEAKRAVFAANMKKIAAKRKKRGKKGRRRSKR